MRRFLVIFFTITTLIFMESCRQEGLEENASQTEQLPTDHPAHYGQVWRFWKGSNNSMQLPSSYSLVGRSVDMVNTIIIDEERIYWDYLDDNQIKRLPNQIDSLLFSGYRYKYFHDSYYYDSNSNYIFSDSPELQIYLNTSNISMARPNYKLYYNLAFEIVNGSQCMVMGISPYPNIVNAYFYLYE